MADRAVIETVLSFSTEGLEQLQANFERVLQGIGRSRATPERRQSALESAQVSVEREIARGQQEGVLSEQAASNWRRAVTQTLNRAFAEATQVIASGRVSGLADLSRLQRGQVQAAAGDRLWTPGGNTREQRRNAA